jgi:hypothetical protein
MSSVCILAGNSRLELKEDLSVGVQPQLRAFEAGLSLAGDLLAETGELPMLSVAFDHRGVFRRQFLIPGLSNSQKRHPRLSQLHPDVVAVFEDSAARLGIALEQVLAIHEDSARTQIDHLLETSELPWEIRSRMTGAGDSNADSRPRVTCASITSAYFRAASSIVKEQDVLLEVFFEDTPWSRVLAYVRGLQLAHSLGIAISIRLNLVEDDGTVHRGEIIPCRPEPLPAYQSQGRLHGALREADLSRQ